MVCGATRKKLRLYYKHVLCKIDEDLECCPLDVYEGLLKKREEFVKKLTCLQNEDNKADPIILIDEQPEKQQQEVKEHTPNKIKLSKLLVATTTTTQEETHKQQHAMCDVIQYSIENVLTPCIGKKTRATVWSNMNAHRHWDCAHSARRRKLWTVKNRVCNKQ